MKISRPGSVLRFVFYLVAWLLYVYVLLWYLFSDQAATLPGAKGFGWFTKFLTFCGFNFQSVALFFCLLAYIFPKEKRLIKFSDDISCAAFGIANVVTVMYWTVYAITAKSVDIQQPGGVKRVLTTGVQSGAPLWLNLTVHLVNSIVAWVDLLISRRSFSKSAGGMAAIFGSVYLLWSYYCSQINKMYPYPFLNEMKQPQGFFFMGLVASVAVVIFLNVGSKVAKLGSSSQIFKKSL